MRLLIITLLLYSYMVSAKEVTISCNIVQKDNPPVVRVVADGNIQRMIVEY